MGRTREMGRHGEDGLGEDAYVGGPAENNTEVRETILECGMGNGIRIYYKST